MHWTVQPGRYCMRFPPSGQRGLLPRPPESSKMPGIVARSQVWCQGKTTQDMGAWLRKAVDFHTPSFRIANGRNALVSPGCEVSVEAEDLGQDERKGYNQKFHTGWRHL